jgi:hypothetical protein
MAVIVETKELMQTVVVSLIGGVGVTVVFSIGIWGAARFAELTRGDRPVAAIGAATVAVAALLGTLAAVALGIVVMTRK